MNPLETLLLPIGIAVILQLLLASCYRSQWLSILSALGGLGVSYWLCESNLFAQLICLSSMAVVALSSLNSKHQEEHRVLILTSVLGALLCVYATDLIGLFLGLELLTLPIYGLIAYENTQSAYLAASIKYLILASSSSAFLLLSIAFAYAHSGSLAISFDSTISLALFLVAACFKLSLFPFHLWTADVYEAAPLTATAYLATVSKIALVAILERLQVPTYGILAISLIAMGSMIVGSLLTIPFSKVPRFLAFSSIVHMGYVLVAWLSNASMAYYMTAYTVSILVIFWTLSLGSLKHSALEGLFYSKPFEALLLSIGFLSLMGIPLTPIFWAKFQIFVSAYTAQNWMLLATFVVSSLISIYGYSRFIAQMCHKD